MIEPEPSAAESLFGERIELARAFTADLGRRGDELGLIGPLELPRLWSRHVLNSAIVAPLLRSGARVADVGSGAGLPGLVLAISRPDCQFVLIEPMARRVDWLRDESAALGLSNVEVRRARAEDCHGVVVVDQVTARAVSSLNTLLPLVVPLVVAGGELLLMKGAGVGREIEKARSVLARLRLVDARVVELGSGDDATRVFTAVVP